MGVGGLKVKRHGPRPSASAPVKAQQHRLRGSSGIRELGWRDIGDGVRFLMTRHRGHLPLTTQVGPAASLGRAPPSKWRMNAAREAAGETVIDTQFRRGAVSRGFDSLSFRGLGRAVESFITKARTTSAGYPAGSTLHLALASQVCAHTASTGCGAYSAFEMRVWIPSQPRHCTTAADQSREDPRDWERHDRVRTQHPGGDRQTNGSP